MGCLTATIFSSGCVSVENIEQQGFNKHQGFVRLAHCLVWFKILTAHTTHSTQTFWTQIKNIKTSLKINSKEINRNIKR